MQALTAGETQTSASSMKQEEARGAETQTITITNTSDPDLQLLPQQKYFQQSHFLLPLSIVVATAVITVLASALIYLIKQGKTKTAPLS